MGLFGWNTQFIADLRLNLNIKTLPENPKFYRFQSANVLNDNSSWVRSSGLKEISSIAISLISSVEKSDKKFTVLLLANITGALWTSYTIW